MNITFIKDCPPCLHSGWSAYKAGDQATLRHGKHLVDGGFARVGWEALPVPKPARKTAVKKTSRRRAKK